MVIDFHCHAGPGDALTAPWNTRAPLRAYLARAAACGIRRTVVVPAFHDDSLRAHRALAALVARHRPRLVGFAMVHPRQDAGRVHALVRRARTRYGFRGIKVHGHDALPGREVLEAARAEGLPLLLDVAGQAHTVEMLAGEYPEVPIVIAHLGSFADDWRAHLTVIDLMVRHANVHADTSGVRRFDYLVEAVRRAGPHKLLFGSDGPWLHPAVELHKIRMLRLDPQAEWLVTRGNAARLLRGSTAAPSASLAGVGGAG
ncbi:MAG: amidohydrolase family protein [Planctomycetes bacterium]|nr:amidohydrolase family protein [Planctomycetota bacterium]